MPGLRRARALWLPARALWLARDRARRLLCCMARDAGMVSRASTEDAPADWRSAAADRASMTRPI